jgi:hypothetical protein
VVETHGFRNPEIQTQTKETMKPTTLAALPVILFLPSCWGPDFIPPGEFEKNRFTPYVPPQGDPRYESSWRLKGPGAIVRTRHYEVEYDARNTLGAEHLKKIAADANNPTERIPFNALSNKRTVGNSFDAQGGWSIEGATEIKAKLNLANATSVDIQFGDTWVSELTEQELRQAPGIRDIAAETRKNLSRGKSHLILKTVYSDSLKLFFKSTREGGGEVTVDIPTQDQQKLGGKYKITEDGGVDVSGPVIVGYVPLSNDGLDQLFPR